MKKKLLSLLFAVLMCLLVCVPALAEGTNHVEIMVNSEADIITFLSSPYDTDKTYTFVYNNPIAMHILCPYCGYNTYRGSVREDFKSGDPDSEGRVYDCPNNYSFSGDVVNEMLVTKTNYCTTCGYEQSTVSDKYYITCPFEGSFIATERRTGGDMHEWLDWWDGYIYH